MKSEKRLLTIRHQARAPGTSRRHLVTLSCRSKCCSSVCEAVDDVVHAELVRLIGVADRREAGAGEFPEVRDVGVEVDDRDQALGRIVVLIDAAEDGPAEVVPLRDDSRTTRCRRSSGRWALTRRGRSTSGRAGRAPCWPRSSPTRRHRAAAAGNRRRSRTRRGANTRETRRLPCRSSPSSRLPS